MKRAAESSSADAPVAKVGKGAPSPDSGTEPIPRPLKLQTITLHFTQRTWEEIGPGELKYLPLSQSPYYMFDSAMLEQLKKFKGIWSSAFYSTPKVRFSNLLMLQDDLINQGGTPMETTAFTQACYMLCYRPTRQTQYFSLANIKNCAGTEYETMLYNLTGTKCGDNYSQLINITNYEDFEKLAILPSKLDLYAGYIPTDIIEKVEHGDSNIANTFFPPNNSDPRFAKYSANMQPIDPPLIKPNKHITWCRNLDKISLHKYGDTFEMDITTNLDGVPLLNHPSNDFTLRETDVMTVNKNTYKYGVEWLWPSNNRPYYSRRDNLSNISALESTKTMKPLSHTFLTMPPIRKANGALLKQRCSFLMEQTFSVTFHSTESIFGEGSGEEYVLNQNDGVIVRPAIYATTNSNPDDQGAFCNIGEYTCKGDNCPYDNSFDSLIKALIGNPILINFMNKTEVEESDYTYHYEIDPPGPLTNQIIKSDQFKTAWASWLLEESIHPDSQKPFTINCRQRGHAVLTSKSKEKLDFLSSDPLKDYIQIRKNQWKNLRRGLGITCVPKEVANASFVTQNRDTSIFYM